MYDDGHFCLLIFAQGTWKDHYKKELYDNLASNFLAQLKPRNDAEARRINWNETYKDPLFKPPPQNFQCDICSLINKAFKEKKGNNDGMILFSHNVIDVIGFKTFFTPIMKNNKIKKTFYFELSMFDEKEFMSHKKLVTKKVGSQEMFKIVDNEKFENGIIYEVVNYK